MAAHEHHDPALTRTLNKEDTHTLINHAENNEWGKIWVHFIGIDSPDLPRYLERLVHTDKPNIQASLLTLTLKSKVLNNEQRDIMARGLLAMGAPIVAGIAYHGHAKTNYGITSCLTHILSTPLYVLFTNKVPLALYQALCENHTIAQIIDSTSLVRSLPTVAISHDRQIQTKILPPQHPLKQGLCHQLSVRLKEATKVYSEDDASIQCIQDKLDWLTNKKKLASHIILAEHLTEHYPALLRVLGEHFPTSSLYKILDGISSLILIASSEFKANRDPAKTTADFQDKKQALLLPYAPDTSASLLSDALQANTVEQLCYLDHLLGLIPSEQLKKLKLLAPKNSHLYNQLVTPFTLALLLNSPLAVLRLLAKHHLLPDLNQRDELNQLPLFRLIENAKHDLSNKIQFLVKQGASAKSRLNANGIAVTAADLILQKLPTLSPDSELYIYYHDAFATLISLELDTLKASPHCLERLDKTELQALVTYFKKAQKQINTIPHSRYDEVLGKLIGTMTLVQHCLSMFAAPSDVSTALSARSITNTHTTGAASPDIIELDTEQAPTPDLASPTSQITNGHGETKHTPG